MINSNILGKYKYELSKQVRIRFKRGICVVILLKNRARDLKKKSPMPHAKIQEFLSYTGVGHLDHLYNGSFPFPWRLHMKFD